MFDCLFIGNLTKEHAIAPKPLRASSWDYARWKALAKAFKMSSGACGTDDFQVGAHWRCWTVRLEMLDFLFLVEF